VGSVLGSQISDTRGSLGSEYTTCGGWSPPLGKLAGFCHLLRVCLLTAPSAYLRLNDIKRTDFRNPTSMRNTEAKIVEDYARM
jgi:hypothetical protein